MSKSKITLTVHDKRKDRLLKVLNAMWGKVLPLTYDEFNVHFTPINMGDIAKMERRFPELVCKVNRGQLTTSTVGIMATITEVMCGDRLALIINSDTGVVNGFTWHSQCKEYPKTVPFGGDKIGGQTKS